MSPQSYNKLISPISQFLEDFMATCNNVKYRNDSVYTFVSKMTFYVIV